MGMNEDKTQVYTDIHTAVSYMLHTNATQITEAAQRPEAPALLPVFLITLMFCNAQRLIGIHRFVRGLSSLLICPVNPVCVANWCC